jgi:hypothetical protein
MRENILLETPKDMPHCEEHLSEIWKKVMLITTIHKSQDGD